MPPGGGASTTACNNKSEGDQCTFTYGGGPKAGQSFSGACSGGVCGAGTQEENPHFACPVAGGIAYTGTDAYKNSQTSSAAPLRGNVGCVDQGPLATRPKGKAGRTVLDAANIYGAMEAGFTKDQPGAACLAAGNNLPDFELPGGVDTNLAEAIMHQACKDRGGVFSQALLDYCGGHADPFHYHERMNCLYTADPTTSHSTRIGTAADGNGIYGHNIEGGCEPTDLDWCGGRTGTRYHSGCTGSLAKDKASTTTSSPIVLHSRWAALVPLPPRKNAEISTLSATALLRVLPPLMGRTTTIWTALASIP